jgi:hypothetical protein
VYGISTLSPTVSALHSAAAGAPPNPVGTESRSVAALLPHVHRGATGAAHAPRMYPANSYLVFGEFDAVVVGVTSRHGAYVLALRRRRRWSAWWAAFPKRFTRAPGRPTLAT